MPRTVEEITAELRTKPIERSFVIERGVEPDEETRTVNLAFASDQPIEHWFGSLALSMKKGAMRTDRLENGAALLMDHNTRDQIGVVENFEIKGGMARADVRFSTSARGEEIFQDVKGGIRRNVSVGFMVHEMHLESEKNGELPVYRSDDWEPYEISIVSIPADTGVGVGRDAQTALEVPETRAIPTPEKRQMTPEEIAAAAAAAGTTTAGSPATEQRTAQQIVREEIGEIAAALGDPTLATRYFQDRLINERAGDASEAEFKAFARKLIPATTVVPPMDTATAAERGGAGPQLATSVYRGGALKAFRGTDAIKVAHRAGMFFLATLGGQERAQSFCRENGIAIERAHSGNTNSLGGFLVPDEFEAVIMDLRLQYGAFFAAMRTSCR
jgi:phage head maturation protease